MFGNDSKSYCSDHFDLVTASRKHNGHEVNETDVFQAKDKKIQDLKSKVAILERSRKRITQKYEEQINYFKGELIRKKREISLLSRELELKTYNVKKLHMEVSIHKEEFFELRSKLVEQNIKREEVKQDMIIQDLNKVGMKQVEEIGSTSFHQENVMTSTVGNQIKYEPGSFVVKISDFRDNADSPIWKIDDKTVLQMFLPFEQDGKKLYRSTVIYSNWCKEKEKHYYPAPVSVKIYRRDNSVVEFLKDQVNEAITKSDLEKEEQEKEE